jgi:ferrous iron transport protein A
MVPLQFIRSGEWADIAEVCGEPVWISRMAELGLRAGSRVQILQPGSPCLLQLNGSRISLRTEGAKQILVRPVIANGH